MLQRPSRSRNCSAIEAPGPRTNESFKCCPRARWGVLSTYVHTLPKGSQDTNVCMQDIRFQSPNSVSLEAISCVIAGCWLQLLGCCRL